MWRWRWHLVVAAAAALQRRRCLWCAWTLDAGLSRVVHVRFSEAATWRHVRLLEAARGRGGVQCVLLFVCV